MGVSIIYTGLLSQSQRFQELRDTYEKQIAANRDEFTRVYDGKLKNLQSKLDETRQNSAGSVQEIRELETKVTGLTSRNLELESVNSTLQKRLADLIKQMEEESRNYRNDMAKKVKDTFVRMATFFLLILPCPGC